MNTRRGPLLAAALAVIALAPAARGATAEAGTPPAEFTATESAYTVTVPPSAEAPGYKLSVTANPLQLTTRRGGQVVLATTASGTSTPGSFDFHTSSGWQSATSVHSAQWQNGVLTLNVGTSDPADALSVQITPQPDRYRIQSTVRGTDAPDSTGMHYVMSSAGHWYGQGEASTPDGGPYTRQPWPLDSGQVADTGFGPSEYQMTDPFWFTQSSAGIWFNTGNVMAVS
ncbi:MAG: hypothetical protein J2P16_11880, partial [Mycobacterium sp.]|nr:hypothetical protein [Mycobacterium sp.]